MKKLVLSCLLAAFAGLSTAHASIICLAPTGTTAGSVQITAPITFTITTPGNLGGFVLDEWVTSDGGDNSANLSPNLAFSVNGIAASNVYGFHDNLNSTASNITANDGYFYYVSGTTTALAVGNTVTLLAGTYTIPAVANFNVQANQTFTGNMFVINSSGSALSGATSAVPEPSTWALLVVGAGLLGFVTLRRRNARRA